VEIPNAGARLILTPRKEADPAERKRTQARPCVGLKATESFRTYGIPH